MCQCQSKQKGRMTLKLSPLCVWACLSVSVCLCDSQFDFYSRRFNLIVYADSDFDLYFLCSDNVWVARPDMTFAVDWTFKTNYLSVSICVCVCVTGEYPHLSKCFLSYIYIACIFSKCYCYVALKKFFFLNTLWLDPVWRRGRRWPDG